jgi:dipeptidyl aminopeptidase/acylaminoacyl peptidase
VTTDLKARYATAESLLPHNLKKLVLSPQVAPVWIRDTETFWYRNRTADGTEYVLVDAEAGTRQPAFDHARMASALAPVLETEVNAAELPFMGIDLVDGAVRLTVGDKRVEVSLDTYVATVLGPVHQGEASSPDGRWAVGIKDHNLYLREVATDEVRQLTSDGVEAYSYAVMTDAAAARVMQENLGFVMPPMVVWSPDSSRFITHRLDQRDLELMHLVRSSPPGGGRPKPMTYRYSVVGDEKLATGELFVFEAATGQVTQVKHEPALMPFVPQTVVGYVWWDDAGSKVYWLAPDRGEKNVDLRVIDPDNGDVTTLLTRSSATQVIFGAEYHQRNLQLLGKGEVLLWSDESGWGHLSLHAPDGTVTPITSGEWLVRKVVSVDEQARSVTFTAAGLLPGSDPYLQELCSVSLDGGEITTITSDGLDHDCRPSKSGRFFVDVMSRWDTPAVSVLRDATGRVVLELEQADPTALYAAGWTAPERVVVKGADGETYVYCAIFRPHGFDPSQRYPVVQEVYSGPQISASPLRFPLSGGVTTAERSAALFAALGFVVVTVDGRGTALRSKAFMDHSRLVKDGDYIADHVTAIRQLAEARPWMDIDRGVGVFGHSGGGLASTKAILTEPDFYSVAVSSAGDHDDALYHSWWGEKYYGLADEFDYQAHANVSLVDNLKGKLFLAHGEMDDNVTPHLTMRLVDALMKANKDFDLLIVPNAEHSLLVHNAYWVRRRWDYFVRHLMGETPPAYRIADIPVDPEYLAMLMGG